jgi:hypothetical protein
MIEDGLSKTNRLSVRAGTEAKRRTLGELIGRYIKEIIPFKPKIAKTQFFILNGGKRNWEQIACYNFQNYQQFIDKKKHFGRKFTHNFWI